jgi:hypothetical protein
MHSSMQDLKGGKQEVQHLVKFMCVSLFKYLCFSCVAVTRLIEGFSVFLIPIGLQWMTNSNHVFLSIHELFICSVFVPHALFRRVTSMYSTNVQSLG